MRAIFLHIGITMDIHRLLRALIDAMCLGHRKFSDCFTAKPLLAAAHFATLILRSAQNYYISYFAGHLLSRRRA